MVDIIRDFTDAFYSLTDAPDLFIEAAAYFFVSTTLGANAKCYLTAEGTKPNLWFLISGRTGITRKSTVTVQTRRMVMKVLRRVLNEEPLILEGGTPEGIESEIVNASEQPVIPFISTEFGGLIQQVQKKDYMTGFITTLSKLYSAESHRVSKVKESRVIPEGLYATAFLAIQEPELYFDAVSLRQGFLRRFLVVYCTPEDKERYLPPLSLGRELAHAKIDELIEKVIEKQKDFPPLGSNEIVRAEFPKAIEDDINAYAFNLEERLKKEDDGIANYSYTKWEYLVKLAMTSALATRSPVKGLAGYSLDIQWEDLRRAKDFLGKVLRKGEEAIAAIAAPTRERSFVTSGGVQGRVFQIIRASGQNGISLSAILQQTGLLLDEAKRIIRTLLRSKQIVVRCQEESETELFFFPADNAGKKGKKVSYDTIDIYW